MLCRPRSWRSLHFSSVVTHALFREDESASVQVYTGWEELSAVTPQYSKVWGSMSAASGGILSAAGQPRTVDTAG